MNLYQLLKLTASLAFAAPPAIVGIEFLIGGEPLMGLLFVGLAALMLLFPEYVERMLGARIRRSLARIPLLGRRFRD